LLVLGAIASYKYFIKPPPDELIPTPIPSPITTPIPAATSTEPEPTATPMPTATPIPSPTATPIITSAPILQNPFVCDNKSAQRVLAFLDLYDGAMDGIAGPGTKTEEGLKEFQKQNNLPVTGEIDPQNGPTCQKLKKIFEIFEERGQP